MRNVRSIISMIGVAVVLLLGGGGAQALQRAGARAATRPLLSTDGVAFQPRIAPSTKVRSFTLTATTDIWLANGYSGLPQDTTPLRLQTTLWYAAPDQWRVERAYLTPPSQQALVGTFLPRPNVAVRHGSVYWAYDALHHTVSVSRLAAGDSIYPGASPAAFEAAALQNPIPTTAFAGGVQDFLKVISTCDTARYAPVSTPTLKGHGLIAGHAAYIVDFGAKPCGWNSASDNEDTGRRLLWVDRQTLFPLQNLRYSVIHPHQLFARTVVTALHYNVFLPTSRFVFRAPPHTRLVPASLPPDAPARSASLADIQGLVSFPLFVPRGRPAGMRLTQATVDGAPHVTLEYEGAKARMMIVEGPLGCCLDGDPRKYEGATMLPRQRTGYLLDVGAQFGGSILWWDQAGTYIAFSSDTLSASDLVRIAAALSSGVR